MIRLEGVTKSYGEAPALRCLDLTIAPGEFLAVMGSSGSGKSTLLNLIGGMDRPDDGRVIIAGEDITRYTDEQLTLHRRRRVGFIFQFFNLLPNITAFENVEMPLLLDGRRDAPRAQALLHDVGLGDKPDRRPWQLSGGEQQRVAIARALALDPSILLADEPTGSLDSKTGEAIMQLIQRLAAEKQKTVVLVTHEDHVARFARRIVHIRDGHIEE